MKLCKEEMYYFLSLTTVRLVSHSPTLYQMQLTSQTKLWCVSLFTKYELYLWGRENIREEADDWHRERQLLKVEAVQFRSK